MSPADSKLMRVFAKDFSGSAPPPVWLMRQAGRFLPEYRKLRANHPVFMDFCLNSDAACEVTLMPLRRYPEIDAAIIFCDILVILHALGVKVDFIEGSGPVLGKLPDHLPARQEAVERQTMLLDPCLRALKETRRLLEPNKSLIGFAGAPWTLACYALGRPHRDFALARKALLEDEKAKSYFALSEDLIAEWLIAQSRSGADVLMLFDSWASVLNDSPDLVDRFIIDPLARVVARVKAVTDKPIIVFARNLARWQDLAQEVACDALGVGEDQDIVAVSDALPSMVVQGNISPRLLLSSPDEMERETKRLLKALAGRRHILNLGHGVDRYTPLDNVQRLLDCVSEAR